MNPNFRGRAALAVVAALALTLPPAGQAASLGPGDVAALLAAARVAQQDGLPAPDLTSAAGRALSLDPATQAAGEADLAAGAVELATLSHGRLARPATVDREWALAAPYAAQADFEAAEAAGQVAAWAGQLRPRGPAYLSLVALRERYGAIVAGGGWAPVGVGPAVAAGRADPRTPALRQRLEIEGYAAGAPADPATPTLLDPALSEALRAFQLNHGLAATGALDAATQAALDVPAADRLALIDLNLERERWMPAEPPAARIEVDTAAQTLSLYKAGQPVLAMRVVVGKPDRRTPMFASALDGVVFNPPWVVPSSIAARELYPRERRQPGYLAKHGFSVIRGQLVQAAGPNASLGALKFEMPSPFGVYLHDTPARSLFSRPQRAFSHGCIRLEQPRALAAALLAGQGLSPADIDAAIAAGATRRLGLATHMPVFIVYRTAAADTAGRLVVRPDLYGWDARLAAALALR